MRATRLECTTASRRPDAYFHQRPTSDGLIRDVLDLASSDVGQLKLVCEPLIMTEVLDAVAVIGEQLAHDKA